MPINDTKKTECPACGYLADAAYSVNGKTGPKPKDVSVCAGCGAINVFDKDLMLILVPDKKCESPEFALARQWQARIRKQRGLPVKEDAG